MQEKKENLTMGNSRHTAMGEGAMPTIEQKDVVQAIDQQKQMEDVPYLFVKSSVALNLS